MPAPRGRPKTAMAMAMQLSLIIGVLGQGWILDAITKCMRLHWSMHVHDRDVELEEQLPKLIPRLSLW